MNTEELIKEARQHADDAEAGKATGNYVLYRELANALEVAASEVEYGKKRAYVDGWERGDDLGNGHYVKRCGKGEADMSRRKAGPWLPVEGITFTPKEDK